MVWRIKGNAGQKKTQTHSKFRTSLLTMSPSDGQLVFLIGILLHVLQKGLAQLPAPQNVHIHSVNLKSILIWDPVTWKNSTVTYSVLYEGISGSIPLTAVKWCTNITDTSCDFTKAINVSWRVHMHVQAKAGQQTSNWTNFPRYFEPFRNTSIGAPSDVYVESRSGSLYVSIADPLEEANNNQSVQLRPNIKLQYLIYYWVNNSQEKINFGPVEHDAELSAVKPWITYCVQVQTLFRLPYNDDNDFRKGGSSMPTCVTTTSTAVDRAGYTLLVIATTVVAALIAVLGSFLFIKYLRQSAKQFFHPPYRIPLHIEEYLNDPGEYSLFVQLEDNTSVSEERFDSLSIVSSPD